MNNTILIIDDDDILRETLAKGLRKEGFYVLTANSAENADETLQRITVDAIVLDRMMTGMDGLTFLKKLRSSGNTTPTIMLTAMSGAENAIDGLTGGANDYLAKPFQVRELILRINNMITHKSHSDIQMPNGLLFSNQEFFISDPSGTIQPLSLSGEEKKLLQHLTHPIGNTVPASPMVAKRLRSKLNLVLSDLDIITIRGCGYKLVDLSTTTIQKG